MILFSDRHSLFFATTASLSHDLLGISFVETSFLDDEDNLVEVEFLLVTLLLKEVHGHLVDFKLVEVFVYFDLDGDSLTEGSALGAVEVEVGFVDGVSHRSRRLDLDWDAELESLLTSDNEIDWDGDFIEDNG